MRAPARRPRRSRASRSAASRPSRPIEGNKLVRTFWGKAWCDNLESYRDYENRLPRGRSYVRHGAVIDLQIAGGQGHRPGERDIDLRGRRDDPVACRRRAGASSRPSAPGRSTRWSICCAARLPAQVMELVTRKEGGLFPAPKRDLLRMLVPGLGGHVQARRRHALRRRRSSRTRSPSCSSSFVASTTPSSSAAPPRRSRASRTEPRGATEVARWSRAPISRRCSESSWSPRRPRSQPPARTAPGIGPPPKPRSRRRDERSPRKEPT